MTAQSAFHPRYRFPNGNLVIQARDDAGQHVHFKVHPEKLRVFSPRMGQIFGLYPLIHMTEILLSAKRISWEGVGAMAIYLVARDKGRKRMVEMAWSAVEQADFYEFQQNQLDRLTNAELQTLAKLKIPKSTKQSVSEPVKKRARVEIAVSEASTSKDIA